MRGEDVWPLLSATAQSLQETNGSRNRLLVTLVAARAAADAAALLAAAAEQPAEDAAGSREDKAPAPKKRLRSSTAKPAAVKQLLRQHEKAARSLTAAGRRRAEEQEEAELSSRAVLLWRGVAAAPWAAPVCVGDTLTGNTVLLVLKGALTLFTIAVDATAPQLALTDAVTLTAHAGTALFLGQRHLSTVRYLLALAGASDGCIVLELDFGSSKPALSDAQLLCSAYFFFFGLCG
jgi:hypothetical protein